jgi:hypothetical protein
VTLVAARILSMPALWKPDLWTSRNAACSKRSRVRSGSRDLCFWCPPNIPTSMYVKHFESQSKMFCPPHGCPVFSNLVIFRPVLYGKLKKRPLQALCGGPGRLLARHLASKSEMSCLLCRVIVVKVDLRMHFSPRSVRTCEVVSKPCSQFTQILTTPSHP